MRVLLGNTLVSKVKNTRRTVSQFLIWPPASIQHWRCRQGVVTRFVSHVGTRTTLSAHSYLTYAVAAGSTSGSSTLTHVSKATTPSPRGSSVAYRKIESVEVTCDSNVRDIVSGCLEFGRP